jgi:RNA polymerase sigma-70 factor (ECF subfamily)
VVEAFLRAWHDNDIPALAALLRDDIILTMPPQTLAFLGCDAVAGFFATVPAEGRLDLIDLVEIRANGEPGVAAYLPDGSTGDCRGYGIMVLSIDGDQIAGITGFPTPTCSRSSTCRPSADHLHLPPDPAGGVCAVRRCPARRT